MPESVRTNAGMRVTVNNELRTGVCTECGTRTKKEHYIEGTETKWWAGENEYPTSHINLLDLIREKEGKARERVRMVCPKCGGMGKLIVKTFTIPAPRPPQCTRPRCLWKFVKNVWACSLMNKYQAKRCDYASHNRDRIIKEKYRTGEPSPQNIKESIKAIIILRIDKLRRC